MVRRRMVARIPMAIVTVMMVMMMVEMTVILMMIKVRLEILLFSSHLHGGGKSGKQDLASLSNTDK